PRSRGPAPRGAAAARLRRVRGEAPARAGRTRARRAARRSQRSARGSAGRCASSRAGKLEGRRNEGRRAPAAADVDELVDASPEVRGRLDLPRLPRVAGPPAADAPVLAHEELADVA